jgi:hypothetical protein
MTARQVATRLIAALAIMIAALCGLGLAGWVAFDRLLIVHSAEGKCWRFSEYSCWGLSPQFVARATGVDLPSGTVVKDSSTQAWLSWRLSATVMLPPHSEALAPEAGVRLVSSSAAHRVYKISATRDGQRIPWPVPQPR